VKTYAPSSQASVRAAPITHVTPGLFRLSYEDQDAPDGASHHMSREFMRRFSPMVGDVFIQFPSGDCMVLPKPLFDATFVPMLSKAPSKK
jgi:hypothetical protein